MSAYLTQSLLVPVLIKVAIFSIIHLTPGGPAILVAPDLTPADRAAITRNLGLDQPLHVQLGKWFQAVVRGDFGRSLTNQRPVIELIVERLPATLLLTAAALGVAVCGGVPLGVVAACRPNSWIDYSATGLGALGVSVPSFWLGTLLR